MRKLIVLVGAPGLGKSTWAENHAAMIPGTVKIVSRDKIRFALVKENEEYFSKEKEVFKEYIKEIKKGLKYYDYTIADATHLNLASRTKLLRALGPSLYEVEVDAVVIQGSLETALKQNENRLGTRSYVPQDQIRKMYKQQTMPSFEEGFYKIYIYQADKIGIKYSVFERNE